MTLDNLIGITLERIKPDPTAIARLLEAAQRNITDAELVALSNENRFDAAYKAIMQLANAPLYLFPFSSHDNSRLKKARFVQPAYKNGAVKCR
jgi:hypothetical protein